MLRARVLMFVFVFVLLDSELANDLTHYPGGRRQAFVLSATWYHVLTCFFTRAKRHMVV